MGRSPLTADERTDALRSILAAPSVADAALTYLLSCLDILKVSGHVYARRHRIKSEDDIAEKVERKRKLPNKQNYRWNQITDIVGLRFITLYRDDIAPVTECIFAALLGEVEEAKQSPFSRECLGEFRLYMSNTTPDNDPLAVRLKDFVARHRKSSDNWKYNGPELGERYSSVHFVTRVKLEKGPAVPIEIQIRSVFEDAWGEVDHTVLYEPRRLGAPMDWTFQQVERQSNALKKMMDAAADFADTIRNLRAPEVPAATIRSTLDTSHYVEQICRAIKVPVALRKSLMALVNRREELDIAFAKNDPQAVRSDYTRLADALADFLTSKTGANNFLSGSRLGSDRRELIYLSRMEEAVCRLLSFDEQQVPIAIARLREVTKEFPDHPVAWFRLGEAYARSMDLQAWGPQSEKAARSAREAYTSAATELDALPQKTTRRRLFAASDAQANYIRDNLSRVHAFLIWRAAHLRGGDGQPDRASLEAASEALMLTFPSLQVVTETEARGRLLNSALYFAAETMEMATNLNADPALPCTPEELRDLVKELESVAPREGDYALQVWDTIAYAHLMLDGRDAARHGASRVLLAHSDQLSKPLRGLPTYVREQEAAAVARALEILEVMDE